MAIQSDLGFFLPSICFKSNLMPCATIANGKRLLDLYSKICGGDHIS